MKTTSPYFGSRRAFSLIELLIVITIIGILVVAFLPSITSGPSRARDVQRSSDIADAILALELYYQDNGNFPAPASSPADTLDPGALGSYFDSGQVPTDPVTDTPYHYRTCSSGQGYEIAAQMENEKSTDNYYKGTYGQAMTNATCDLNTSSFTAAPTATGDVYAIIKF